VAAPALAESSAEQEGDSKQEMHFLGEGETRLYECFVILGIMDIINL